jgi:hypothetical protein
MQGDGIMSLYRASSIGGIVATFILISGCDSVDLKTITIEPDVIRTFVVTESSIDKTWGCYVPPIGICALGEAAGWVEDVPDKKEMNVGYNYKNDTSYSSSCGCNIQLRYRAIYRPGIFFDLSKVEPKVFFSAKLIFQDGDGFKLSGTTQSNENTGTFKSINAGKTEWFKLGSADNSKTYSVVSQFPTVGDKLVDVDWASFAKDANQQGEISFKKSIYAANITKTVQGWRDKPETNRGVFLMPVPDALPGGYPKTSSAAVGNFWAIRLSVTYNAKHKANAKPGFPSG